MILDMIKEWFRELLIDGIISNLSGMFDTVNTKVGEIAGEVGMTPSTWNGSIFSMIQSLSETVILPIAGIILTFVMGVIIVSRTTNGAAIILNISLINFIKILLSLSGFLVVSYLYFTI